MNEAHSPPTPRDHFWFHEGMRDGFILGAISGFVVGVILAIAVAKLG